MYKINKENLSALFSLIADTNELYVPCNINGTVNFAAWDEDVVVDLDTLKTVKSPKDAFFPQSETLYTCKKDGRKLNITPEELQNKDFVVFGMKACDVRGLEVLDKVFLVDPVDSYYKARREHGIIVSLACSQPEESCFCNAFGIAAANAEGDVQLYMSGDELYWSAVTEKAKKLRSLVSSLLSVDLCRFL